MAQKLTLKLLSILHCRSSFVVLCRDQKMTNASSTLEEPLLLVLIEHIFKNFLSMERGGGGEIVSTAPLIYILLNSWFLLRVLYLHYLKKAIVSSPLSLFFIFIF